MKKVHNSRTQPRPSPTEDNQNPEGLHHHGKELYPLTGVPINTVRLRSSTVRTSHPVLFQKYKIKRPDRLVKPGGTRRPRYPGSLRFSGPIPLLERSLTMAPHRIDCSMN